MIAEVLVAFIGELIITIFVEFIWRRFLYFIGGTTRWVFGLVWRTIARKPKYQFEEYINGPKNSKDWFDNKGHGFVNGLIGLLILAVLIISLIYFL